MPMATHKARGVPLRAAIAILLLMFVTGCVTSSRVQAMRGGPPPPDAATILVVAPDIQLSIMTAAGLQQPRADWSQQARNHVAESIAAHLRTRGHTAVAFAPEDLMDGRTGQLLRLHEAVASSILLSHYSAYLPLPTKRNNFSWTLGDGVQEIAAASDAPDARYALFLVGRGSYASGGRVAAVAIGAVLGVGLPMGSQIMYVSLVDLQTGNIVWFNLAHAGSSDDMREADGAQSLVTAVLKSAPL